MAGERGQVGKVVCRRELNRSAVCLVTIDRLVDRAEITRQIKAARDGRTNQAFTVSFCQSKDLFECEGVPLGSQMDAVREICEEIANKHGCTTFGVRPNGSCGLDGSRIDVKITCNGEKKDLELINIDSSNMVSISELRYKTRKDKGNNSKNMLK